MTKSGSRHTTHFFDEEDPNDPEVRVAIHEAIELNTDRSAGIEPGYYWRIADLQDRGVLPYTALSAAIADPKRDRPSSLTEMRGFLFALCCSPGVLPARFWLPIFTVEFDVLIGFEEEDNAGVVMTEILDLYLEVAAFVDGATKQLPPGVRFMDDILANLEPGTSVSQWSTGFARGFNYWSDVWQEMLPFEIWDQFLNVAMILFSFAEPIRKTMLAEPDHVAVLTAAREDFVNMLVAYSVARQVFTPDGIAFFHDLARELTYPEQDDEPGLEG